MTSTGARRSFETACEAAEAAADDDDVVFLGRGAHSAHSFITDEAPQPASRVPILSGLRMRRLTLEALALVALASVLAASATASTAAPARTMSGLLPRGEQLARFHDRARASPMPSASWSPGRLRRDEQGFRTYIPAGTEVHSVTVTDDLATVDVGERFTSGNNSGNRLARLAQLVGTVSAAGAARVQLLINGAKVSRVFPRIRTERPITLRFCGRRTCRCLRRVASRSVPRQACQAGVAASDQLSYLPTGAAASAGARDQ